MKSVEVSRSVAAPGIEQHRKNLRIYGYTRIPKLMAPSLVENLLARVRRLYESTKDLPYAGRPDRDYRDKIIYNLQNKDKAFIDLLDVQPVQRLVQELLNDPYYRFLPPDKANYILNYYNARSSGTKLELHIDSHVPAPGPRTWAMQAAFVLEPMTLQNGCTVVVPGSHLSGEFTDRGLEHLESVLAEAGDVVLWDSRTWHGTTENKTDSTRWTLIATFTAWWLKQTMDMTRSLPHEIYSQLSPSQKALLGFCSIPPQDEFRRINTKAGYEDLLPDVHSYYAPSPVSSAPAAQQGRVVRPKQ